MNKKILFTALSLSFSPCVQATEDCDKILTKKISKLINEQKEKEFSLENFRDELINLKKEYIQMVSNRQCKHVPSVKAAKDYNKCIDQADKSFERQNRACEKDKECRKDTRQDYNQRVQDCKEVSVHDSLAKSTWSLSNLFKK
jgi:hypothetical protein